MPLNKLFAVVATLLALHAWAGSGSLIDCESLDFCRAPEGSLLPYEVPALTFFTTGPTQWEIGADVWFSSGCQGEPDHMCRGSGFREIEGMAYLVADIDQQPVGTTYSIQWIIAGCPEQPCIEGTLGSAPDICAWVEG